MVRSKSQNQIGFLNQNTMKGTKHGIEYIPNKLNKVDLVTSQNALKLGIVGLSPHSAAFSTFLNDANKKEDLAGCHIEALYHPPGNPDVEFTDEQLLNYKTTVVKAGVRMVSSMEALLELVDGILIETNDGRPHMEQVLPALKAGKPVFVDKPVAEDLRGVVDIYQAASSYKTPIFSSSSLRYGSLPQEINTTKKNKVLGANTYSPAPLEPGHTDLYWYGIHGVEMLYTVMGTGCRELWYTGDPKIGDVVTGRWNNDRIGVFRGQRKGRSGYGGTAFLNDETLDLGGFDGYRPLVVQIAQFFRTNTPPVSPQETLEIYAFMTAAHHSKLKGGKRVHVPNLLKEFGIDG